MTTALRAARVAALIALLGFAFPWVLVSCQGAPVGRLSGFDLATGGLNTGLALPHAHPNLWVALSLAALVAGLVGSFVARGRSAAVSLLAAAIVALLASLVGVSSLDAGQAELQPSPLRGAGAQPSGAAGQTDLQYGYFMTLAGLLAAIGACGAALARREGGSGGGPAAP